VASLIAVAGFSLALLGFVTMAGIAVALGVSPPNEFWLLGTSIAGVLTGILIPPTKAKQDEQTNQAAHAAALAMLPPEKALEQLTLAAATPAPAAQSLSSLVRSDWRLAILGTLFVVSGGVGLWFLNAPYQGSTQLFAVAGATGATALGILVPSPKLKPPGSQG
jgi:Na+-translocating ferredoxin:NAD+ oxidoreductase RnfG subunit